MEHISHDSVIIGTGPVRQNITDRVVPGGLTAAVLEP